MLLRFVEEHRLEEMVSKRGDARGSADCRVLPAAIRSRSTLIITRNPLQDG